MTITSIAKTNASPEEKYKRWKDEICQAEKELEEWHESGRKVNRRYLDEREALDAGNRKFNIFTANVGILQSALYSKIPEVDVDRRFKDPEDDIARVASNIMQRAITQDLNVPDCLFSQVMTECIEERLVPGLGQAWVRLETDTTPSDEMDEEGNPIPKIVDQRAIVEHVHWEDFLWSPCRTWSERRWVGRRVYMDRDKMVARFGEEIGRVVKLDYSPKKDEGGVENDILQKAIVYEIWDRQTKSVIWLSKSHPELLDSRDDPLQLESFEPCPRPLFALSSTSKLIPRPDYVMLQDQYAEMDDVNNRISLLVAAVKVVGVYDRSSEGVQRMMNEGVDNTLIPVDNWAMFAEKGGIKGQIDWLPLEQVISALERLRTAREDIKVQIYELTGISDIARGSTKASETLGAQQIKAQMASIRIQQLQDSVANFAAAIFRIKGQIIAKHFTPEQILKVSAAEYIPESRINPQLVADAVKLIKNDQEFLWRVNVDADSMKMADYAQEKQERSEFVTSMATYLQSAATMIKAEPAAAPLLVEMLKYATAGHKGSKHLEGVLDQTLEEVQQAQKNPKPDPEQAKQEADMKMEQARFQMEQQGKQFDMQAKQLDYQMKEKTAQLDAEKAVADLQYEQQRRALELDFAQQKQMLELQGMREKQAFEMQAMAMKQQTDSEDKESERNKEQQQPQATAPVINIGGGRKSASIVRDGSGKISGIEVTQQGE